jgi:hypothetical protein
MAQTATPEWFTISEQVTPLTFQRLADATSDLPLPIQVRSLPRQAFWFLMNSLYLANQANRVGMHANALSITRQCLEAVSIIELGLTRTPGASDLLGRWEQDRETPGSVRKWLEGNAWSSYGNGLWSESWSEFMSKLCSAIQPYAHYSSALAQWQERLHLVSGPLEKTQAVLECGPRTYDPQKATRITLYHALITYALARAWLAASSSPDPEFDALVDRFRISLGKSVYLDGDKTNWDQQFWAMMWFRNGDACPE